MPITNQLLVSVASARQKYETYLATERQEKSQLMKVENARCIRKNSGNEK